MMQIHTVRWQPPESPAGEREIVTGVHTRLFTDEGDAKRFWERMNARSRRKDVSVLRTSSLSRNQHLVLVLGKPEHVTAMVRKAGPAGAPHQLDDAELEAVVLNRLRHLHTAAIAGRPLDMVIRRSRQSSVGLHPDGTTSPLQRPQG